MKAIAIKMKTYASESVNIVNNDNLSKRILYTLLWLFGALALCYIVILGSMVFNIVERKALETNAQSLSNDVSSLELQYLSISNKIDPTLAKSMGFGESTNKSYAIRKSLGSIKITTNEL
jgi:hypothetical protein